MRTKAPTSIKMVWTKSVHMTAVRPPAMVKNAANASRIKTLMYNHSSLVLPIVFWMNRAPANRSACPGASALTAGYIGRPGYVINA